MGEETWFGEPRHWRGGPAGGAGRLAGLAGGAGWRGWLAWLLLGVHTGLTARWHGVRRAGIDHNVGSWLSPIMWELAAP
jgi:hypothetical protein